MFSLLNSENTFFFFVIADVAAAAVTVVVNYFIKNRNKTFHKISGLLFSVFNFSN